MTPRKSFVGGCLLGGVLSIVLLFGVLLGGTMLFGKQIAARFSNDAKAPKITTGAKADYSLKVTKPDGTAFDFASTKGKPVFLNFWSPNCPHCQASLPLIDALYKDCSAYGVEFMCVAVDNPDQVPGLIQQYNLTVPVYNLQGQRPPIFDSESAPITFFITKDGEIALRLRGSAKWDDDRVLAAVTILALQEPS